MAVCVICGIHIAGDMALCARRCLDSRFRNQWPPALPVVTCSTFGSRLQRFQ